MPGSLEPTAGRGDVVIRRATIADAVTAAHLHADQLDESFLSMLGPRFLKHLYRRMVRSPSSFLLIAEHDDRAVGFASGSMDVGGLYKQFLLRDGLVAALTSAPRLIRAWPRALETLRHGNRLEGSDSAVLEFLSLAVDQSCRGLGIGRLLTQEVLEETRRRGMDVTQLVVARDNLRAITLYESLDFRIVDQFDFHPGRTSILMEWSARNHESH